MKISEVSAQPPAGILDGADFADAWRAHGIAPGLTAQDIAARLGKREPAWISGLMRLRNRLVKPLGLKTELSESSPAPAAMFPILSSDPGQVVLGINDKHLDFRVVVSVEEAATGDRSATATTYVRTHNLLGRWYLAVVKPFHRAIVPSLLKAALA